MKCLCIVFCCLDSNINEEEARYKETCSHDVEDLGLDALRDKNCSSDFQFPQKGNLEKAGPVNGGFDSDCDEEESNDIEKKHIKSKKYSTEGILIQDDQTDTQKPEQDIN